jgi:hypothetical protein
MDEYYLKDLLKRLLDEAETGLSRHDDDDDYQNTTKLQ